MKILALKRENSTATQAQFQRYAKEEARAVWELYHQGVMRELYFRADQPTAVLVLECASTGEATTVLANLPLVKQGLVSFELIPLAAYPGFARLFGEEHVG